MMTLIFIQCLALFILLIFSAFFSSTETAYFSLNPLQIRRLEKKYPEAGQRIGLIMSTPTRLLATILIGNTLVNVTASSLGFEIAERLSPAHAETISVPVMTLILVIFGEIGPKRIALFWPEHVSVFYARFLPAVMALLSPVHRLVDRLMQRFEHLFHRRGRTLTDEELQTVMEISREEGVLDPEESKMVHSIINLQGRRAGDVMTPRVDVIGIDLNDPSRDHRELARQAQVRYVPLYRDNLDHIEGFLDVLRFLLDPAPGLDKARSKPLYVPDSSPLDALLAQFQKQETRVAVVVDEYGGTAGVITRGDIIEEITGEIDDEFGAHKSLLEPLGPRRWLADGNLSLEELNDRIHLNLTAEGADRLSGWITSVAGRLPRAGDTVEAQGCRATVKQVRRNRVTLVQLETSGEIT